MEFFNIICVTCQAKLSVRNESLIGQIVACPRCDSMVEVTAPQADVPVAPPQPVHTPEEATTVAAVEEATSPTGAAEVLQASVATSFKYKTLAWSLASFFVGATLVGSVLYSRNDSNHEAATLVQKNSQAPPTPVAEVPPTQNEPAPIPSPFVETQSEVAPKVEEPAPLVEEKIAAQPVAESVEQPAPVLPVNEEPAVTPRVARRFDPLDFDPENLTLATIDQPIAAVESVVSDTTEEPVEIAEEVPSTVPLVRRGPRVGEDASGRDAEKQLALLIPGVELDRLPLVDCLRLFSLLSGVPVSVSPEQLLMAGITSQKKVSLEASDVSLGVMLQQVLEPLRLTYVTRGAQVVVVRQEAAKRREITYPVDDLVAAGTSEKVLAGWVQQLVAPTTWQTAGGKGTLETTAGSLRIVQTQQVQYQVLILLERLRLARNLSPRSRYPVERLAGTPANVLLSKKLAQSTTFTFSQYTTLDNILVYWQTELGATLLIDWPALADVEAWPHTTITCAIIDQPWSTALEKVLEPLGLGWRATTGGAIEITSADKVLSELQLEVYPLRRNFEGDVAPLRALAKQRAAGVVLYDPAGKVLLALESAATQRLIFRRLLELGLMRE